MPSTNSILVLVLVVISGVLEVTVEGSKILILNPVHSGSQVLTLKILAESLSRRGHQVDIIKWKDAQTSLSDIYNSKMDNNISLTTLALDNSNGRFFVLTQEKEASFSVRTHYYLYSYLYGTGHAAWRKITEF